MTVQIKSNYLYCFLLWPGAYNIFENSRHFPFHLLAASQFTMCYGVFLNDVLLSTGGYIAKLKAMLNESEMSKKILISSLY